MRKNKYENLISKVEGTISESKADNNDPTLEIEYIILKIQYSLLNNFISMKKIVSALLTIFSYTYQREKLFSSMNVCKIYQQK